MICIVFLILQSVILANDTNLFSSHGNIKDLFNDMNLKLNKIPVWFKAKKLSLNEEKAKYTFFHKSHEKEDIPLKSPMLAIKRKVIKWTISMKFLGTLLNEDFSWKNHISVVENKFSKNSGAFYKTKNIVNKGGLKTRKFSKSLFFFCT